MVCKHSFRATINVVDQTNYAKMKRVELKLRNVKVLKYSVKKPVQFVGKFVALIETQKQIAIATFYVAKTPNCHNLVSSKTAQDLDLFSLHLHNIFEMKDK